MKSAKNLGRPPPSFGQVQKNSSFFSGNLPLYSPAFVTTFYISETSFLVICFLIPREYSDGQHPPVQVSNIAKGTTDPRVEFISQVHSSQFTNLDQITISEYRLSALTSKSQPNISISTKSKVKILTKPSFRILTKIKLHNLNQTSAAKY